MARFRSRFNQLVAYEEALRKQLLSPLPSDPTAIYTRGETLLLKGYCILVHAAIEEYLEQTAVELVDSHCSKWKLASRPKPTMVHLALMAHHAKPYKKQELNTVKSIIAKSSIEERLEEARQNYHGVVKMNNGITVTHLKKLLRPTGMSLQIGPDRESALSQLKKYRGEYAHRGQITKCPSAKELTEIADECLLLCAEVRDAAGNLVV